MLNEECLISLPKCDILQILDALEAKATAWEYTLQYAEGTLAVDESVLVEEHRDADDARAVLHHYTDLISKIRSQLR